MGFGASAAAGRHSATAGRHSAAAGRHSAAAGRHSAAAGRGTAATTAATTSALREIAGTGGPAVLAGDQTLPVWELLAPLFPRGSLRRGTVVGVAGSTALLLAVLAGPSAGGSWTAIVGMPALGAVAAAESGVDLARCALVPEPGPTWATVVAALLDAVDVVAVRPPGRVRAADARRLSARARERGSVLVVAGGPGVWDGADVRLSVVASSWSGIGRGYGALRTRRLDVAGGGRGAAARERRVTLELPPSSGGSEGPS